MYQKAPFAGSATYRELVAATTSPALATAIRARLLDPDCIAPTATYLLGSLAHAASFASVVASLYGTSMHTVYEPRLDNATFSCTPVTRLPWTEYVPAEHARHAVAAWPDENVPDAQAVQVDELCPDANRPIAH